MQNILVWMMMLASDTVNAPSQCCIDCYRYYTIFVYC